MSQFTRRYKEHVERYGRAFIQDVFASPQNQAVDYCKLENAELHTMMAYDKALCVFVIYCRDNDDREWVLYTRRRPMNALKAMDSAPMGKYYDVDNDKGFDDMPPEITEALKVMRTECAYD